MQRSLLALALLGLVGMAAAVGAPGPAPALLGDDELSPHDFGSITGFLEKKTGHGLLADAVEGAIAGGLLAEFEDELISGNFTATLFAPTDEAFATLPPAIASAVAADPSLLVDVLKYHIVPGQALTLGAIKRANGTKLPTLLEGQELEVKYVGTKKAALLTTSGQEVPIYQYNTPAGNVIVHTIKEILVPGTGAPAPTAQ